MYILFCKSVEFCNVAGSTPISTKTRENTAANILSFVHFFSAYFLLKLHIIHKNGNKKSEYCITTRFLKRQLFCLSNMAPPVWFELSGQMPVAIAKTAHCAVS